MAGPSLACPNCSDINGKDAARILHLLAVERHHLTLTLFRKHDDDRRFICTEEGCGKSFTRAEHLKGHSITHLGTKPFQCHAEGIHTSGAEASEELGAPVQLTRFLSVVQAVMQGSQLAAAFTFTQRNTDKMAAR